MGILNRMMNRSSILLLTLACAGCSLSSLYPGAGSVSGAAVGGTAGPAGAAAGALGGYGAGALAQAQSDGKSDAATAVQTLQALSEGDVKKLLELKMQEQGSKIDGITSTIWTTLKVAALVIIGFFLIPIIWSRQNHKKIKEVMECGTTRPPFPVAGKDK